MTVSQENMFAILRPICDLLDSNIGVITWRQLTDTDTSRSRMRDNA